MGPWRLTKALGIGRELNGVDVTNATNGLWIEDRSVRVPARSVTLGPRVGVDYAGPVWAAKPWRFIFELRAGDEARLERRRAKSRRDSARDESR